MTATTETTALTLPERAAVALGTAQHEVALRELATKYQDITAIKNKDGREQCHSALMTIRGTRTSIEKVAKAAREDATAFSKAVIAEEKRLIGIIDSEEERLRGLRDAWDAEEEARKQAGIEAERLRVADILERIDNIRNLPLQAVGKSSQEIGALIYPLAMMTPDESFMEFLEQAQAVRFDVLEKLAKMEKTQQDVESELAAARQEAERQRLSAEEEAARIKAEQESEAAKLAAERAELERLRKEQEAREATARAEREAEETRLRAEREADEQRRREEHEAAQAELKAAQDKMNAELAEREAAIARQAEELRRQQEALDAASKPAMPVEVIDQDLSQILGVSATMIDSSPTDQPDEDDFAPTAGQIIGCVAYAFKVSEATALEWLRSIDFHAVELQEQMTAATVGKDLLGALVQEIKLPTFMRGRHDRRLP